MDDELEVRVRVAPRSTAAFVLDIELEVPPGITILFGPSGSGKSTTLAAIAGLVKPERGYIRLGAETWFDSDRGIDRAVHTRGVAFVFQSLALFPHLSALGNVEYGIDRREPRVRRKKRALEMLERMRVPHLADRYPRTFSGGEAQRVALARAFAMSPKIVLLDEAFSAMDRELRRELAADVRRYVDEVRVPLVQVTHHRNEARAMGDRVVLMEAGRIKAVGSITELLPELSQTAGAGSTREELFEDIGKTPLPLVE